MKTGETIVKNPQWIWGIVLISFLVFASFKNTSVQTDNNPLSGWDKNILEQANTAATVSYLTDEEKKIIFYTNLCRLKPKLFEQTILAVYLNDHSIKSPQVGSLKRQLNEDKSCGVLIPDLEFSTMASNYAKKMGEEGKEGHIDFQKRMKPFMGRFSRVGENCEYGHNLALDAFMNLLIDAGEPDLGHRKNILDPDFKALGVSCQPHKVYHWNFVMDFGG